MADANNLRTEFFNAQRALVSSLFADRDQRAPAYVQMALDRMTRAFNALMISTLKPFDPTASETPAQPAQELRCAYAVNAGDDWNGSKWQVMFVNGEPVSNPATVGEFTRQMTADGWKVFNPQAECESDTLYTPDGEPVYALYFCRDIPTKKENPSKVTDLPDLQIAGLLLNAN
jgi:hypothetical protein